MADSLSSKARIAKFMAQKDPVNSAAIKYVNSGMKNLNLTSKQVNDLSKKLVPIVARVIGAERSRTALRAEGIQNREVKKAEQSAKRKILGGK